MRTGIGYNGAFPEAIAGAGAWHFFGSGPFGAFVDGKVTTGSETRSGNFCPAELGECTIASLLETRPNLDFQLRDEDEWLAFNAGGAYALSPEFALLLGAGFVRQRRLREFVTESEERWITDNGTFFVNREPGTDWGAQAVIGGLVRMGSSLAASFTMETRTSGVSIGLYWVLP